MKNIKHISLPLRAKATSIYAASEVVDGHGFQFQGDLLYIIKCTDQFSLPSGSQMFCISSVRKKDQSSGPAEVFDVLMNSVSRKNLSSLHLLSYRYS